MRVKVKRVLVFFLASILLLSMVPVSGFASGYLPEWEAEEAANTDVLWQLPQGTIIHPKEIASGKQHIVHFGVSFAGSFIDDQGRTVLKVQTSQQNGTKRKRISTNPDNPKWSHIVFKFDQELFDLIDFEDSYALSNNEAAFADDHPDTLAINKFTKPEFATTDTEMMIDYVGVKFGGFRRDVYLVLKDGVTWADVAQGGDHKVETRIFNEAGNEVWSMHSNAKGNHEYQFSYSTYTYSFVVTDLNAQLAPFYTGRLKIGSGRQLVMSKNARVSFQPEEGILKVLYFHNHNHIVIDDATEAKAFSQAFSKEFLPYLKVDDQGRYAKIYKGDEFGFNRIKVTFEPVPIKPENLVLHEGMYQFIAADQEFTDLYQGKLSYGEPLVEGGTGGRIATLPSLIRDEGEVPNRADAFFYGGMMEVQPESVVVEYNVDVEKMNRELFKDGDLAHTFNFESMLLEAGMPVSYFEYTPDKDIIVPKGSLVDINYGKAFKEVSNHVGIAATHPPTMWSSNVYFGNQKALDLVLGLAEGEYYGKDREIRGTRYKTSVGFTIPKGTPIRIVNLDNKLSIGESNIDELNFSIAKPDGEAIVNQKVTKKEPEGPKAEILQVSVDNSAGVVQKSHRPLIHEIFTSSFKIQGLVHGPNSWLYGDYPITEQKVYAYEFPYNFYHLQSMYGLKFMGGRDYFVPENERYKVPTKSVNGENIGEVVTRHESGRAFKGYPIEFPTIFEKNLTKDMPISFKFQATNKMESEPVIEQVQAKVTFNLSGQSSKFDGTGSIEKIAPLNQEYAYEVAADGAVTENKNPKYVASGFAILDGNKVEGGEHLKIEETPTVTVSQKFKAQDGKVSTLEREVINFTDHNGNPYAINAEDATVRADQVEQLLKRQFPVDEEVNLPNAKRIVGWTTKKLVDIEGGKTAEEQFYDLLDKKDAEGQPSNILRKIEDWEKVDKIRTENYVFDALTPIDRHRTVYAVYGGPAVVLHSGVTDAQGNEIVKRLPIEQADIDNIDKHIANLDANSQATVRTHTIIKELPQAPYTDRAKDVQKADLTLQKFKKEGHSFIGWRAYGEETGFKAGDNNDRITALQNGVLSDADGNKTKVPKSTESYSHLLDDEKKATLPNGFNFSIKAEDFSYIDEEGRKVPYQTVQDIMKNVKDIHLYAVYRPFFEVTVHPQYRVVDTTDLDHPQYADRVVPEKQKSLQIGLLYRTAVTGYGVPTVDAAANYNPIGDATMLKTWTPKTSGDPKWSLPGFDILGQRRSYVSVVVPVGKEDAYTKFSDPFSETSWSKLGISTYVKSEGNSLDPNAPKNLYEDTDPNRDPYGIALAKTQAFEVTSGEIIDAFTSATARKPLLNTAEEVTGYDIVMTNALETLPTPKFETVRDTDTEIKLEWPGGVDYDGIDKVELILDGITYSLVKQANGTFAVGEVSASVVNDRFVVKGIELADKGGKDITGQFLKTTASGDVKSAVGNMRILSDKTSAPVEVFRQDKKQGESPVVNFTVPDKLLDQVGTNSKYTVEKYDAKTQSWVSVAQKIMKEEDKVGEKYGGNSYAVALDPNTVAHGDKLRIVAEEYNPNSETHYSKPAPSATVDLDNNKVEVFVILDLEAPTGEITGTDETFRRFVNLEGMLDEVPDGQKVNLELNTTGNGQGAEGNETLEFESKDAVIKYLYSLQWREDMPDMWVIAQDKFGNQAAIQVTYEHTLQLGTSMLDAKARKKYVNVTSDKDGATVTITVYRDGNTPVARGQATVQKAGEYVKLDFFTNDDGVTAYRLKKGDRLHMTGELKEGETLYTANPVDKFIK